MQQQPALWVPAGQHRRLPLHQLPPLPAGSLQDLDLLDQELSHFIKHQYVLMGGGMEEYFYNQVRRCRCGSQVGQSCCSVVVGASLRQPCGGRAALAPARGPLHLLQGA